MATQAIAVYVRLKGLQERRVMTTPLSVQAFQVFGEAQRLRERWP